MTIRFLGIPIKTFLIGGFILLAVLIGLAISKWGEKAFLMITVLVIGVALILASVLYERLPLYLLVASLPLAEMLKTDVIPTTLLVIPGSLAIFALLVAVVFRKKPIFIRSTPLFLGVLLGVWTSIATMMVGSLSESRPYWLVIVLLLLIPNLLTKAEHLLRASWVFLIPLGALGTYVFIQRMVFYLTNRDISIEALHLSFLQTGDVNITGFWITLGIPFAYYLFGYYKNEPGKRFWLLAAGLGMLAGALATLSLGVAVGLCVIAAMIVWFQKDMQTRLRLLVLIFILLFLVFNEFIAERAKNQQLLAIDSSWGNNRGEIWAAGAQTILDHPLVGIGLDPTRRMAMVKYTRQWFIQDWYNQGLLVQPHSIFLSVGVETGLPGLAIYILLLGSILFPLLRLRRQLTHSENDLLQALVNIGIVVLISSWTQGLALSVHLDKLIWVLMGFAVALVHMANNAPDIHEPEYAGACTPGPATVIQ